MSCAFCAFLWPRLVAIVQILCGLCLSCFLFGLSDKCDRLLCLGHVPLGSADVVRSHSRIVVLYTLCRISQVAGDVVHRPVRSAQLIHFAFDTWGKADRRHAPNVARGFSVGNSGLPINHEFAYEVDPETGD